MSICGQSVNPLPIRQSLTNLPISDQSIYPMPTLDQADMTVFQQQPLHTHICHNHRNYTVTSSIANPMSMHLAFPFFRREQVIYWDPPLVSSEDDLGQSIPNSALHQSTPMPILVNPVPIMCQSRSIQCQYTPVPVPIWSPSGSINCQSIVSSGQICPCLANTPIKCQYWTYLPIPGQSTNPMPIQNQSANSLPIRQFITNPPIQYQYANLIPILD